MKRPDPQLTACEYLLCSDTQRKTECLSSLRATNFMLLYVCFVLTALTGLMVYSSLSASDTEDNLKRTSDTANMILETIRQPGGMLENANDITNQTLRVLLPFAKSIVSESIDILVQLKAGNFTEIATTLINEAHDSIDWITRFRASLGSN